MFKIDRIDHFVMRVSDVEATCAFYSKALGMEVITFRREHHRPGWHHAQSTAVWPT